MWALTDHNQPVADFLRQHGATEEQHISQVLLQRKKRLLQAEETNPVERAPAVIPSLNQ